MIKSEGNENLVKKFAEGDCTHEEALAVIRWFKEPDYRIKLFQALTKLWYRNNETKEQPGETVNLSTTLDRLHHRINIFRNRKNPD